MLVAGPALDTPTAQGVWLSVIIMGPSSPLGAAHRVGCRDLGACFESELGLVVVDRRRWHRSWLLPGRQIFDFFVSFVGHVGKDSKAERRQDDRTKMESQGNQTFLSPVGELKEYRLSLSFLLSTPFLSQRLLRGFLAV